MSAAIGTGAYGEPSAQAAASSRPQVQSRRVSLKLGPLGLTYATDELLWPRSGSMGVSPPSPPSGFMGDPATTSAAPSATGTASEGAYTTAAPDFAQELLAATRLADEARQEAEARDQAYGPARTGRTAAAQTRSPGASQTAAPAAAMRRAIAAYLSCAAGAPAGMLSAVA